MIETVGDPITVTVDTATAVPLTGRPESATHARVTITPAAPVTDAGSLVFGTDPGGNNPSFSWTLDDVEAGTNLNTTFDFPLDSSVTTLYFEPSGFEWLVTIQYVIHVPTEFSVNAEGDSYGISGDERGEPTLIAAVATNGKDGYVYRQDLEDADGTTAMKSFKSPDEALAWQEAHAGEVITIPVYEADGKTQIGELRSAADPYDWRGVLTVGHQTVPLETATTDSWRRRALRTSSRPATNNDVAMAAAHIVAGVWVPR